MDSMNRGVHQIIYATKKINDQCKPGVGVNYLPDLEMRQPTIKSNKEGTTIHSLPNSQVMQYRHVSFLPMGSWEESGYSHSMYLLIWKIRRPHYKVPKKSEKIPRCRYCCILQTYKISSPNILYFLLHKNKKSYIWRSE